MKTPQGMYPLRPSTPSLLRQEPLLDGRPAPSGTLFMLGEQGGYAAIPAPKRRLVLGRNIDEVHVPVGTGDWYVSREHATVRSEPQGPSTAWWLRNDGRLPIRVMDHSELLQEQEIMLPSGYTPLYIRGSHRHVVEVLISNSRNRDFSTRPDAETRDMTRQISDRERLVLVAMYQDHLSQTDNASPLSWKETSRQLNKVPGESGWTERQAEHVVEKLRYGLAKDGVTGVTTEQAPPEAIKRNLLRVLLDSATLVPTDLRLLENGIGGE